MAQADEAVIAEEAQRLLDREPDQSLPGLEAETKVSVLGTAFATSRSLVLGERVELRVVGFVNFAGDQLIDNEGKRHVVKIQSSLLEFVDD